VIFFAGNRIEELHLSNADLATYAGRYRSTELDATYNLSVIDGILVLRSNWDPTLRLNPLAPDEFENEELETIVFHRDTNHHVSGLSVFSVNARNVRFEKIN